MPQPPEDRPTEPRRPRDAAVTHERTDVADRGWAAGLDDQLRSLKGLVAMLGVLAAAALGVALYALLSEDDADGGTGGERVSQLDDRVGALEDRAESSPEEADVKGLRQDLDDKADQSDVEGLGEQVDELRSAVEASSGEDAASAEDLTALSERVDELAADVEELQEESGQSP